LSLLAVNAGSSSWKLALFDDAATEEGLSRTFSAADHTARDAIEAFLAESRQRPTGERARVRAVGHRIVHGGAEFTDSVRITPGVRNRIAALVELAPLHNRPALEAVSAAETALPGVPQAAAFDTAFFSGLPEAARVYPLPWEWYAQWGIRRFGFHGLSHGYCAARAVEVAPLASSRIVSCHLGNGCSAAAILGGKPRQTTMGYTPMEGLVMGARSGSVDPGILLHVQTTRGIGTNTLETVLNTESGLRGVSGVSGDYREVEAAARSGNARARLALDIYADRLRAAIAALAASLGGLDAIVFTGGVGEHSASLRAAAAEGLGFLGVRLDPARNAAAVPDCDIASAGSPVRVLVIRTREELVIARETRKVIQE
jgi:acetate kinase